MYTLRVSTRNSLVLARPVSFSTRWRSGVTSTRILALSESDSNSDSVPDEDKAFQIKDFNRSKPVIGKGESNNLINAMQELSKGQPRSGGNKAVFGPDQLSWREVDAAVNEYPQQRLFTAIGTQSSTFKENMVSCVEKVLKRPVHPEAVIERLSSGGKYTSVKIGPVVISSPDEVVAVYNEMKADERLKYFI